MEHIPDITGKVDSCFVQAGVDHRGCDPHPANIFLRAPVNRLERIVVFVNGVSASQGFPSQIHKVNKPLAIAIPPRCCQNAFQSFLVNLDEIVTPRSAKQGYS